MSRTEPTPSERVAQDHTRLIRMAIANRDAQRNQATTAHCPQCHVDRRITGTLGPGDGRNHLTLATCGHVVTQ